MAICSRYAGGTTASNSNGNVTTTTQVDPSGCASIVTYTGTGSAGATIGHGLSKKPALVLFKRRNGTKHWMLVTDIPQLNEKYLNPNRTMDAEAGLYQGSRSFSNNATSTTFYLEGATEMNGSDYTIVAYFFARCDGYIDVKEYEGTGTTDGPYIALNHTPAYVWIKRLDADASWPYFLKNQKTSATSSTTAYNSNKRPHAWVNLSDAVEYGDTSNNNIDFGSNFIKIREDNASLNASGGKYLLFSIGEQPAKYAVAQ